MFRALPMPLATGFVRLALLATLLPWCAAARADADDTFNTSIGLSALHDSNLFRQVPGKEQADTVTTTAVTLALGKPYGLQRFAANVTLVDYQYQKHSALSYQATNYNAAWNWSLTPRLHGTLAADRSDIQNSFVDYSAVSPGQLKNVRRTENRRFNVEWEVNGGLRAVGGITQQEQTNSQSFVAQNSFSLTSGEAGIKYIWPAGTTLQWLHRQGDGTYKGQNLITFAQIPAPFNPQIDTRFRQREEEALLNVPFTGKSSLTARLARQSRAHEHFPERDYAVLVGRLDYQWQPTGKLLVNGALRRDVAAYQTLGSSYYTADGLTLQPVWQATAKVALRLKYDLEQRRYQGAIFPGLPELHDTLQSVRLAADWLPRRWGSLSLGVQRDSRESSQGSRAFHSTMVSLDAQINF